MSDDAVHDDAVHDDTMHDDTAHDDRLAVTGDKAAVTGDKAAVTSDDLFRALADPTRRRILDLLAEHGSLTVSVLAAQFPGLVASGISKHLMALRAAGLVTATRQGRNQRYAIDADAMSRALAPWLARYEVYWAEALTRLRAVADPDGGTAGTP